MGHSIRYLFSNSFSNIFKNMRLRSIQDPSYVGRGTSSARSADAREASFAAQCSIKQQAQDKTKPAEPAKVVAVARVDTVDREL